MSSEQDWRITDQQYRMITDKAGRLSKKEAGLLIDFIQHCIFNRRLSEYKKNLGHQDNSSETTTLASEDTT